MQYYVDSSKYICLAFGTTRGRPSWIFPRLAGYGTAHRPRGLPGESRLQMSPLSDPVPPSRARRRAPSGPMQQPPFAQDRPWKRSLQKPALLKVGLGAYEHVGGGAAERQVCQSAPPPLRGCIVGHNDQQVIVAIRARVSPRHGTKEINALGLDTRSPDAAPPRPGPDRPPPVS